MKLSHNYIRMISFVMAMALLIALPVFIYNLVYKNHARLAFSCTADYNVTQPDLMIRSEIYLIMEDEGHASFDIVGSLKYNKAIYKISRKYTFNYQWTGDKIFKLTNISLSKRGSDNANDTQMEHFIFNYGSQSEKIMHLTKIMNSYVISNVYSPLFICTSNS